MRQSNAYELLPEEDRVLIKSSAIFKKSEVSDSTNYVTNQRQVAQLLVQLNQIVLDKPQVVKLALSCVLAGGHLLLQDLPGMGKTTLAQGLAQLLGLSFNRVQFTNDMLPADILGMSIYDQSTQSFEFRNLPNCYWLMRLTAPARRRKVPCLKRWRRDKSLKMGILTHYLSRSLSSQPKTQCSKQVSIRSLNRN